MFDTNKYCKFSSVSSIKLLSMKVKNVKKLYDHFCKKNITLGELKDNPWGDTSFNLIDPEGNRIAFFTPNISKSKYYKVKSS